MTEEENKFYFRGVFYDTYDEFTKAHRKFNNSLISNVSTDYLIEDFKKNLKINLDIYGKNLNNAELSFLLNQAFIKLVTDVQEKFRKK